MYRIKKLWNLLFRNFLPFLQIFIYLREKVSPSNFNNFLKLSVSSFFSQDINFCFVWSKSILFLTVVKFSTFFIMILVHPLTLKKCNTNHLWWRQSLLKPYFCYPLPSNLFLAKKFSKKIIIKKNCQTKITR